MPPRVDQATGEPDEPGQVAEGAGDYRIVTASGQGLDPSRLDDKIGDTQLDLGLALEGGFFLYRLDGKDLPFGSNDGQRNARQAGALPTSQSRRATSADFSIAGMTASESSRCRVTMSSGARTEVRL